MTAARPLPEQWARLHPLSPLVHTGRAGVALLVALLLNAASRSRPPYVELGLLALVAVTGTVAWLVTRWRIHGGELQLDTGLIRRQQVRVPLTRIQGIDIVRPVLARLVGVSEVRLVLAGHDTGRAKLAYLEQHRANAVRAELLALAHGLAGATPEPPERPVLTVANDRIVVANLLAVRFGVGVLVVVAGLALTAVHPATAYALLGTFIPLLAATLAVTAWQTSAEWGFHVAEAPDGLRLRSGLLQTRSETIPYGRVQAVRWIEPLRWRPMGWVRLEVDVARRRGRDRAERQSATATRALLPVGTRAEARWLLSRVLPGADAELGAADGAPARVRWRAPLARRYLRAGYDDRYVTCSTGRLRPDVVVVPLAKVQSFRRSQGPWSRRLGLASVHLDTAGHRFTGKARFRDESETTRWLDELPDLARRRRHDGAR